MGTALIVWRKNPINPRKRRQRMRTICEVLRELYRDAEARSDALSMTRIDEAHDMAKRMERRMRELNRNEPYIVSEKK
jgi:hypothetical protein